MHGSSCNNRKHAKLLYQLQGAVARLHNHIHTTPGTAFHRYLQWPLDLTPASSATVIVSPTPTPACSFSKPTIDDHLNWMVRMGIVVGMVGYLYRLEMGASDPSSSSRTLRNGRQKVRVDVMMAMASVGMENRMKALKL